MPTRARRMLAALEDGGRADVSSYLPHRRATLTVAALILIDLPFFVILAVAGWHYGWHHTYTAIMDYRWQHPWTFLPTAVVAITLVRRWRRS